MNARNEVWIPCGTLSLEGVLEYPGEAVGARGAAVICHPHPLFGGNMHNNVVRALRKALLDRDLVCLRFNFRGTGASWGAHGHGTDEIQDVIAALDFLQQQPGVDREKLLVSGYSFGCWVALAAAAGDARPARLVGISPPLNEMDFSFLKNEHRPKFLVVGDSDFVCSEAHFRKLLEEIPEPKVGVVLPNTDHFHVGREHMFVREMNTFLDTYPL
ncbi:MAG TPA: alpha/beta fold hydrolase [Desulfomonilaceae bacterium]|nr:alpha/beta fold hydrolase [Desulfomonilaceae bacterium]